MRSDLKILYLTDANPDYLSDDVLYGLRSGLGTNVVDYPRKDVLYRNSLHKARAHILYGLGFHCFGLDDLAVDRTDILRKIRGGYFDVIINSSAWRIHCPTHPQLVVLDGEDHGTISPRYRDRVPLYFKRELFAPCRGVEPILFSLPDFLHDDSVLPRVKRWHASFSLNADVRRELASVFPPSYVFKSWQEYRADIKQSWFGLSPKGAGYDCQRHYEILGQSVLCVYLDHHAPGLLRHYFADGRNCLTFSTVAELREKLERCGDPQALIEHGRTDLSRYHLASKRADQMLASIAKCDLKRRRLSWLSTLEWGHWLRRRIPRHTHLRPASAGVLTETFPPQFPQQPSF